MAARRLPLPAAARPLPPGPSPDQPAHVRRLRAYGTERLLVYCCGGHGDRLAWTFARGARARLAALDEPPRAGWDIWIWGLLRGTLDVIRAAPRGWWYADHGYVLRGHDRANYRVTLRGWQLTRRLDVPPDRWRRLEAAGARVRDWRHRGGHVLVCPPTAPVLAATGQPSWLQDTLDSLCRHTDRPIRVRHKTACHEIPLAVDLANCHALVTQHSMAAVEAVMSGVPVFVAPSSAAASVGCTDLSRIEQPVYPEREQWLHSLAYGQFHLDEFGSGAAWRILRETQRGPA